MKNLIIALVLLVGSSAVAQDLPIPEAPGNLYQFQGYVDVTPVDSDGYDKCDCKGDCPKWRLRCVDVCRPRLGCKTGPCGNRRPGVVWEPVKRLRLRRQ